MGEVTTESLKWFVLTALSFAGMTSLGVPDGRHDRSVKTLENLIPWFHCGVSFIFQVYPDKSKIDLNLNK